MLSKFVLLCLLLFVLCSSIHAQDAANPPDAQSNNVVVDPWQGLPMGLDPTRVIDLALEEGWRVNHVLPTARADDAVFVRRVYLDLVGRIPETSEANAFLECNNSGKREALVNSLLDTDEHAEHFAEVFDAILIGRTDAEQLGRRTKAHWIDYLKRFLRENRPWNEVAQEIVLARSGSTVDQGANWYLYSRNNKPQDIAEAVSKDFFGVRIDCAQCHDHPLASEIEQRHYWGLVAFFNRSKNVDTSEGPGVSESAIGGFSEFSNLEGKSLPNELVYLGNRRVEESRPTKDDKEEDRDELYVSNNDSKLKVPKFSRRGAFVENVLTDHPLLARATVNRLWGWMMGRGLVHPVDTLDSYHPPSHPGLLDWLARDLANSNYDIRRLIRSLALTRAYQLSSAEDKFVDPQWFTAALPKPLTAEMLQRSIIVALDPADPSQWNTLEHRASFAKSFPDVLAEESISNVAQGLLLTNGQSINDLASMKHSQFLRSLRDKHDTDSAIISKLFQTILGRIPDADEINQCQGYLSKRIDQRDQAIEGIAWAILTSSEFRFNH